MGVSLRDLYEYDAGLARQFWNRANASSARLIGKSLGLIGRGAGAVGWDSARDALSTQRAGFLEEANEYEARAGAPRSTAEKVAGFAGAITPDLLAYGAAGQAAGIGRAVTAGGRIVRGVASSLPITAAIEADSQEGSTAKTLADLLGSPKLDALSRSAAGRFAVGAALDVGGNVLGEGIVAGIRKLRPKPATTATVENMATVEGAAPAYAPPPPRVPELETANIRLHPDAEVPKPQTFAQAAAREVDAFETTRTRVASELGDGTKPVRYAAAHEGDGHTMIVHRSTQEPGKFQVTRLDAAEKPYGHETYASLEEAAQEVARAGGNRVGAINPAVLGHVAGTGIGGVAGAQVGDTPEERRTNALLGAAAGLGVAAAGTVAARTLAKARPGPIAAMADPDVQKVRAMITTNSKGAERAGAKQILKDLYNQNFNKLEPLNEFSRRVLGNTSLREAAQNGAGWIEAATSRLHTDFTPVVKAADGIEDAVEALLVSERALELDRNGLSQKGVDLVAAKAAAAKLSADPKVAAAADAYRAYYRQLLTRRMTAGLISPEEYNRLVMKGEFYTPFVRDVEHGVASNAGKGSKGLMQKGSGLRKMTDEVATSKIEMPLRQAMADTYALERSIARQRVNDLIVKGWVTNPQAADQFVRQLPKGAKPPAGYMAETIRVGGQDVTFAVDKDFHRAWTALAPESQDWALKFMGAVKNVQRFGVTMALPFTIRNAIRDLTFTAVQQPFTRHQLGAGAVGAAVGVATNEENPVEGAVMGFSSGVVALHGVKILRAMGDVMGRSKLYEEYLQAGGGGFGFWPRTQKDLDKVYRRLRDGVTAGDVVSPKGWLEALEYINHAVESAPRVAEARRIRGVGGTLTDQAFGGRNISVDFSLSGGGTVAKLTDQTSPFFNATKQGIVKTLTVLKSPKAWAMGGVLITAPSVALWNINKDDPEYWKQPLWVRNTTWLVKKEDGSGFRKIVKPHEFGYIFASLPERLLDWAYQNGKLGEAKERVPYSLGAATKQMAGGIGAGPIPGLVKPVLEVTSNYDFFRDKPVVSEALRSLPTEMQYDDRTSSIGRGIGALTGTSPVKVDHLVRGYFGTAGAGLSDLVTDAARGVGLDDRGPEAMNKDRGLLGSFSTDPLATPQPALDVLSADRDAAKLTRVAEHLISTGQYDKIGPWYAEHAAEMGAAQLTQAVAEQLRLLARVELQVERDRTLPIEEKRQRITEIRDAQYQLAKVTVPQQP